jgi:hypothetical protein
MRTTRNGHSQGRSVGYWRAFAGNRKRLGRELAQPGGDVTGSSSLAAETAAKIVELIREMVPSARRVAVLANALDPFSKLSVKQIRLAGEAAHCLCRPTQPSHNRITLDVRETCTEENEFPKHAPKFSCLIMPKTRKK